MFEHSVRVPRLYKVSSKILRLVKDEGGSLKELVYQQKHFNIKALYALVAVALQRFSAIDLIIKKSELLIKEPRFDPWLARILIAELLWGKKQLPDQSTPLKTILSYRETLEKCQSSLDLQQEPQNINKVQKPRFVRVNTLAITAEDAISGFRDENWKLVQFFGDDYQEFISRVSTLNEDEFIVDFHIKELLIFPPSATFYNHRAYKMRSIVLQDKASCLPSYLLNPTPGSTVLDMCAAPGMKTTHLAAILNNRGTIYAVEKDEHRFNNLNKFIEKFELNCIKTVKEDVLKLSSDECPNVEYILVDPSCSGSGITNRVYIDGREEKPDLKRLEKLQGFQILILKHALLHFPMAKRVVYSTCSIYPQENECVVEEVLKSVNNFELVCAKSLLNSSWENSSTNTSITEKCLYMKPENDLTNGFFIAVFERIIEDENVIKPKFVEKTEKKDKPKNKMSTKYTEDNQTDYSEHENNDEKSKKDLLADISAVKNKQIKKKCSVATEFNKSATDDDEYDNNVHYLQKHCKKSRKDKILKISNDVDDDDALNESNVEQTLQKHSDKVALTELGTMSDSLLESEENAADKSPIKLKKLKRKHKFESSSNDQDLEIHGQLETIRKRNKKSKKSV